MAPATKNGGKMVACHSGTIATAKSNDTTVWTESTSGVESPPSSRYTFPYRRQWMAEPRQPRARIPYTTRCHRFVASSRRPAKSGTNPTYQNTSETVKYVVTANTSQTSGLLKLGGIPATFGN